MSISIHALLAESDTTAGKLILNPSNFYPRSPCGERLSSNKAETAKTSFLSTLSLRRATVRSQPSKPRHLFLSTLSLRRATGLIFFLRVVSLFLSTLSLRRATYRRIPLRHNANISIHALLAESDSNAVTKNTSFHISIHALLAESDRCEFNRNNGKIKFLSTLSLRRATAKVHKTVEHFCAYETNFMEIASSC